jgi:serine protease Do
VRGFLGVNIQDVTRDIADSVALKEAHGALVQSVGDDSPGGMAGLNSGDIITAVDGDPIDNALDLTRTIQSKAPGTTVELTVWRNQAEIKVSAKLGQRDEAAMAKDQQQPPPPADIPPAPEPSSVGITVVPNSGGEGLLIQDVKPDTPAADRGFATGDVILQVDNKDVKTAAEFEDALKGVKDKGLPTALIKAERNGEVRFLGLPLDAGK